MTHRGLFDHGDAPPVVPPSERLQPGQPGKAWKRQGTGWGVTCKDGSRVHVSPEGRVTTYGAKP